MMRLTVHVEDAPFEERERKFIGKDEQGKDIFKPKKSKCIRNTLSFKNLKNEKDTDKRKVLRKRVDGLRQTVLSTTTAVVKMFVSEKSLSPCA
jgi:hypothetical protein